MKHGRASLLLITALALMGVGGYLIHPGVGLALVGFVLWVDLLVWSLRK